MRYFLIIIISLVYYFYDYRRQVVLISNVNNTRSDRNIEIKSRCIDHCDVLISLLRDEHVGTRHSCTSVEECFSIMLRYFTSTKLSKRDITLLNINQYYFIYNNKEIFFIIRRKEMYQLNNV